MSNYFDSTFDSRLGKEPVRLIVKSVYCGNFESNLTRFGINPSKVYFFEAIQNDSCIKTWTLSSGGEKNIQINSRFTIIGEVIE